MARYNIAFQPTDKNMQSFFVTLSQKYFGSIHDNYILGTNGLAHVTLCQFYAATGDEAVRYYNAFSPNITLTLHIESFRIRSGTLVNAGKYIADLAIKNIPELSQLQKNCCDYLKAQGSQSLTPAEKYSPHITLARLSEVPEPVPTIDEAPYGQPLLMKLVVGESTESGVLLNVLADEK
jgi:hypothetical protein